MICFKQDHMLHMQFDQMIQAALDGWTMGEVYAVDGNDMIFALENGQVRAYSFSEGVFFVKEPAREVRETIAKAEAKTLDKEMLLTKCMQFLLMTMRREARILPFADKHMISVLEEKLNKQLVTYQVKIVIEDETRAVPSFYAEGEPCSLEKVMQLLLLPEGGMVNSVVQYVQAPTEAYETTSDKTYVAEGEAELLEKVSARLQSQIDQMEKILAAANVPASGMIEGHTEDLTQEAEAGAEEPEKETSSVSYDAAEKEKDVEAEESSTEIETESMDEGFQKAMELFRSIVGTAKPGSEVYNAVCFSMGDIMYFKDELEHAAYFYQLCDVEKLENAEEYFERLGHCYLDNQMSGFADVLKEYYRASHNEAYRESHKEALEAGATFSKAELEQYRLTCIEVGKKRYGQDC